MRVGEIIKHLEHLPQPIEFDWPGVEHWPDEVFDRRVKTLEEAIAYIKELKARMEVITFKLHDLAKSYNQIINWIRQIETTQ